MGGDRLAQAALIAGVLAASLTLAADPSTPAEPPHEGGAQDTRPPAARPHTVTPPLPPEALRRGAYQSVQVNVDADGNNIVGDAANEPSLAVDPTDPDRMVIGWRQFDTVESDFREAGWAYSQDAGRTWTFPGVLIEDSFRTDPVLDADSFSNFYYQCLVGSAFRACDVSKSVDGGVSWAPPVDAFGGDKNWMIVDHSASIGADNIYCVWRIDYSCCGPNIFTRSTDLGATYMDPVPVPLSPAFGTMATGPEGELYIGGIRLGAQSLFLVAVSTTACDPALTPSFDYVRAVSMGGSLRFNEGGPNPGGVLGQVWVATDRSGGPYHGRVYMLASLDPTDDDPLEVHIAHSDDNGNTWSTPVRVNDDPMETNAYQWFGTLSVAPNGRLDAVWNDTRNDPVDPSDPTMSELYYSYSVDGGQTWSANEPITPPWDHFLGYPQQDKIGDYYHMISDDVGADLAYAATFNGEQDIYFLRIGDYDCNRNGVGDSEDIASGTSDDYNGNGIPDECEFILGDMNCDGAVDAYDIDGFVAAVSSYPDFDEYHQLYPDCNPWMADCYADGIVNSYDIDCFIGLVGGG